MSVFAPGVSAPGRIRRVASHPACGTEKKIVSMSVHMPAVDRFPRTDYLVARRVAFLRRWGQHLVKPQTLWILRGGCDDGR